MVTRRRLSVGMLLALVISVVQVGVGATAAEARCVSSGHGASSTLLDLVIEQPLGGACNNDGHYQAKFMLTRGDGIARVYIQNNGHWQYPFSGGRDNAWHPYDYSDSNSNSWMTLCYTKYTPTVETYCGWGSNVLHYVGSAPRTADFNDSRYHGVNAGF